MAGRLELHDIFKGILGSNSVYFQPPDSVQMVYPCIVYELSSMEPVFADNVLYTSHDKYSVTLIDPNPDNFIRGRIAALPRCKAGKFYTADNLHHYPFTIYY